ncbi:hypothetical protein TELCIR_02122 [Teladorsagia circumcincta]|uniref:Reverse transcriptase domain-containing protein n=1 Tax=Teladorsagia circumcincta TaxID=45464 RepID=A0A2G9V011_TELCI|nr:hypothetical protein TELCIR_02122 [Teladorsagia circumcincta]
MTSGHYSYAHSEGIRAEKICRDTCLGIFRQEAHDGGRVERASRNLQGAGRDWSRSMLRLPRKKGKTLSNAARSIGFEIHPVKTKWMKNAFTRDYCLRMGSSVIEEVSSYVYLGQAITISNDLSIEIGRRRRAGWATFYKYRDVLTDRRLDARIKARVLNTHVLPASVYGSESGAQSKRKREK